MKTEEFIIKAATGLHARPAAKFVDLASQFDSEITLVFGKQEVNAKSIISVLSLGVGQGEKIKLVFDGPDENEAFRRMKKYMKKNLCSSKERYDDIIGQDFKGIN